MGTRDDCLRYLFGFGGGSIFICARTLGCFTGCCGRGSLVLVDTYPLPYFMLR